MAKENVGEELWNLSGAGGFCLIPTTYQNGAVLVSVGNLNLSQNDAVLIFILIFFFLLDGILVT